MCGKAYGRICTKFGSGVVVEDVITLAKFFGDRLRDIILWGGGSKIEGSH